MTTPTYIPAADIERETALSLEILRRWRQSYDFPIPVTLRDGSEAYECSQLEQLLLIRDLVDAGFKPSLVVGKPLSYLQRLTQALKGAVFSENWTDNTRAAIVLLQDTRVEELTQLLTQQRREHSLSGFVQQVMSPLIEAVGEAWSQGVLTVFQEHLCTDVVLRILSAELLACHSRPGMPRILFATPTDEFHALGMLMARCVLADHGANCIGVGPQTPAVELAAAAVAWQADIVALSFSFSYAPQRIPPLVTHLRNLLPEEMLLWIGGAGASAAKLAKIAGVQLFNDLASPVDALAGWDGVRGGLAG